MLVNCMHAYMVIAMSVYCNNHLHSKPAALQVSKCMTCLERYPGLNVNLSIHKETEGPFRLDYRMQMKGTQKNERTNLTPGISRLTNTTTVLLCQIQESVL